MQVNCAALPESIAESELFGHVKGAFTGAVRNRMGKFELAHEATLFLDEIGEMPLSIQAKLLRALQFGEIQRIGSDSTHRVNVRVIAATNRNLQVEVDAGRFRADLYHRLSVYPVHLPPLRERREDISLLAGHLLDRARIRLGLGPIRLMMASRIILQRYDWPGNIRELDHVVTRAALRASKSAKDGITFIEAHHLDLTIPHTMQFDTLHDDPRPRSSASPLLPKGSSLTEAVDDYQRQLIADVVRRCEGNWSKASRRLKIDRSNLHRLARRLGLKKSD